MLKSKSLIAFFCCCVFLFSVTLYQQKMRQWGEQNQINWDACGYYLYLPSIFYDDLAELHHRQYIIDNYNPCGGNLDAHLSPLGKYVMKYSSGQAIMFLPGFIIGHFWAKYGGYTLDGFSAPYQISMHLYGVLFCCIGLWFIRKVLLIYFEDILVALALLVLCFGTNYLNYSTYADMLTHGYLFTIYSIIIYLSIGWLKKADYKNAALLGLLTGLAALTRPTDVISVFIPLAWGISSYDAAKARIKLLISEKEKVLVLFIAAICVGSIQLIYWKIMSGHFLYWSYDDPNDGFSFLRVRVHACLFSYKKGWWVYTPVMVLSIIGFVPLFLRRKEIFWPTTLFSMVALYLVFSWKNWAYGGSFSQRAVVQYYAILIFPVTAFFDWVKNNLIAKILTIGFCLGCVYINLVMTYQANISNIMECNDMTKEYYWAIFGRPTVPVETRNLIYTDELLPSRLRTSLKTIYTTDTLKESADYTDTVFDGRKLFVFDKGHHKIPGAVALVNGVHSGWFRVNAFVAIRQTESNLWKQPYIYAALVNENGEQIKFKSYLIPRIVGNDHVNQILIDIKVPDGVNIKAVRGGLSNNDNDKMVFGGPVWVEYTPMD